MNKIGLAVVCLMMATTQAVADRFEYEWSHAYDQDYVRHLAVDAGGYVFVVLEDKAAGPESSYNPELGAEPNKIWLHKYDPDGGLVWSRMIVGPETYATTYDGELILGPDDAIYLTGVFNREVHFDPNGSALSITGFGTPVNEDFSFLTGKPITDNFLLKLDSSGQFVWAVVVGTSTIFGDGIQPRVAVSPTGEVYFVGRYSGPRVEYGPNVGGGTVYALHSAGGVSAFPQAPHGSRIFKFDANGAVLWSKTFSAENTTSTNTPSTAQYHWGLALDNTGKLLLFGNYRFRADLDPGPNLVRREYVYPNPDTLVNHVSEDLYLLRLTPQGDFYDVGVMTSEQEDVAYTYGTDAAGMAYVLATHISSQIENPVTYIQGEREIEVANPDAPSHSKSFGVIRLDSTGSFVDTRALPVLSFQYPDEDPQVNAPEIAIKAFKRTPVNSRGDLFLPYERLYDLNNDGIGDYWPLGNWIVKLDTDLMEKWRAPISHINEYNPHRGTTAMVPGPGDTLYLVNEYAAYQSPVDLDPSDGLDLHTTTPPEVPFTVLTKLQDVLEPDVLSITRLNPNPTNAPFVQYLVTIDEPVTGVDISDFALTTTGTVTGAAITGVTGADGEYTVTVSTGSGDGTIRLDLIDDDSIAGVTEPLGGPGADDYTDGEAYTMDHTAPVATFALPGSELSVINSVEVLVSFNEPVTGLDASDFAVTNGTITNITGDGTEFVITVLITNPGDMTLDLTGGGLADTAGNGNGPTAGLTVTFLDINGDPSVPGPTGVLFVVLLLGMGLAACRPAPKGV